MSDYTWYPSQHTIEDANVSRLARSHGIRSIDELRARSVEDVAWFWDAVVNDLGLPFRSPYSTVLDLSAGIEYPEWFVGGALNLTDACLSRWSGEPAAAERTALIHESEDGTTRTLTFRELDDLAARAAGGLRRLGIGRGDRVAILMPMVPEAVVACYAVARLGAVLVPLFSGFAPRAIATRIQDSGAEAVVVADGTLRRGKTVPLKALLDEALPACPTVQRVVVVDNIGMAGNKCASQAHETSWGDLVSGPADPEPPAAVTGAEPFLLAYTSGTTGRPKGAVHTQPGFLVKTASEVAYSFDVRPGGRLSWITDMGWIMGPLTVVGTHANGAALVLYEGSPDVPDVHRLWRLVERHRITMLGVSPTLVRALRAASGVDDSSADVSSVQVLGSTGEPWDPQSYEWLARDVFAGRLPVINFSGGTEVGGSFLAPYPVEPIRSCSLGGPSLGMDVDVVDAAGHSIRGAVGELICRQPWPSMTRGVWKDSDRYLEAYWSTFPGVWHHGDFARVDADGQWFILGRSDDVMNVAGKRLAPAEVEAVLISHPAVAEAAAVGVPDPAKGEAVWAFWVARDGADGSGIGGQLKALVATTLGKPFAPTVLCMVSQLPKTRSAKVLRRAIRAAALGDDPGDLSGAENPEAIDEIRAAVKDL